MYTLLKPLSVREELLKRGVKVFTPLEFKRIFHTLPFRTKYFLEEQVKLGLFVRLKRGLYALKTDVSPEEEIANRLYKPSYISFEYALAFYNILPEMVYRVTSATTKPTRNFAVGNKVFSYYTIKEKAYAGYYLVKKVENSFLIAEPEKALVDYLYFTSIGKKPYNDRLRVSSLNKEKVFKFSVLYERKKLIEIIKELL